MDNGLKSDELLPDTATTTKSVGQQDVGVRQEHRDRRDYSAFAAATIRRSTVLRMKTIQHLGLGIDTQFHRAVPDCLRHRKSNSSTL